ncbi:MAG: 50S ribosomal protein L18Ae [Candidatus Thermoplasmatota archaeon]|nr:50S ribosomal protein L18Ae [Candidatus Thermoplasmatota archaeon]
MKAYRAIGTFRTGKTEQKYTIDLVAADEEEAKHRVYSNFGSRHGTPRRFVNIASLSEINPLNSTAPQVIAHFRDTHDFSAPPPRNEEE